MAAVLPRDALVRASLVAARICSGSPDDNLYWRFNSCSTVRGWRWDLEFTFAVRGRNIKSELPSKPLGTWNLTDAAMLITPSVGVSAAAGYTQQFV